MKPTNNILKSHNYFQTTFPRSWEFKKIDQFKRLMPPFNVGKFCDRNRIH